MMGPTEQTFAVGGEGEIEPPEMAPPRSVEEMLETLEDVDMSWDAESVEETEIEAHEAAAEGEWVGDDMSVRLPTSGLRLMAFNRQRHPLNSRTSIKYALTYMQAMHIDIGVFHECGEVGAQDVQDRIENYAREEGAMAIVAGTKTAAAKNVVEAHLHRILQL